MPYKDKEKEREYRKEYHQQYREKNKDWIAEKKAVYYLKVRDSRRKKYMLTSARKRAKQKGFECTIKEEDIIIPEKCPILGYTLERGIGGPGKFSPSLDRIDVSKGYVPGNIQVLCQLANVMKNEATAEELINFAEWVLRTYKKDGTMAETEALDAKEEVL